MYRIIFFGEPASGKTTLSTRISEELDLKVIEASKEVIFPVVALKDLPEENELIAYLTSNRTQQSAVTSREIARKTFSSMQKKYGGDIIAKVLHKKYVNSSQKEPLIFSGLRGVENAEYCRLHNDLVVYLKADESVLVERLSRERGITSTEAVKELIDERDRFRTHDIESVANLVVDTGVSTTNNTVATILKKVREWNKMCVRCVNVAKNPAIKFNESGLCHICEAYEKHFDPKQLEMELGILNSFKGSSDYDVMVGFSGGKDSTATLFRVKEMGFTPLAFTFDTGYLPDSTIPRAKKISEQLGVDHVIIDLRPYVRDIDIAVYEKLATLYERPFTLETKRIFREAYKEGRKHYSIKCSHTPTYVRTCQICRRLVIRAYHAEATSRGIGAIILGMNEWTNLSASQEDNLSTVSGMRVLQPLPDVHAVSVFHLPFLLQRTIEDIEGDLSKLGWRPPKGEDLIESNSNSCLLARSTERTAKRLLEFHPDSTRLAREVTAGFISRDQALSALGKLHPCEYSVREVLKRAKIL